MLKPLFDKKNQVSRPNIDQVMANSFNPMSRQNVVILSENLLHLSIIGQIRGKNGLTKGF